MTFRRKVIRTSFYTYLAGNNGIFSQMFHDVLTLKGSKKRAAKEDVFVYSSYFKGRMIYVDSLLKELSPRKKMGRIFSCGTAHACTSAPIAAPTIYKDCGRPTPKFIQNLCSMSIFPQHVHISVCWFMHGPLWRCLVKQGQLKNGFSKAVKVWYKKNIRGWIPKARQVNWYQIRPTCALTGHYL